MGEGVLSVNFFIFGLKVEAESCVCPFGVYGDPRLYRDVLISVDYECIMVFGFVVFGNATCSFTSLEVKPVMVSDFKSGDRESGFSNEHFFCDSVAVSLGVIYHYIHVVNSDFLVDMS